MTRIMGIINVTPDSFSRDGLIRKKNTYPAQARRYAEKLIREGADIVDVGGESSRPGALPVSTAEEIDRVIPLIKHLARKHPSVPISVDTYKPLVARKALEEGASIVNNICGSQPDKQLLKTVRDFGAAVVLMHMRGNPRTMQKNIRYRHLIDDIARELKKSIEICLEIGIKSDRIIIDPGIGFGKTPEHNLQLISGLNAFHRLKQPILIGTSRKSFIGKILQKEVHERLMGTAATVTESILQGAHIVRLHDVGELKDLVIMTDAIINANSTTKKKA